MNSESAAQILTRSFLARAEPYIHRLVWQGGPETGEYQELDVFLAILLRQSRWEGWDEQAWSQLRAMFGDSLSRDTLLGWALLKPHGYAGDFEIIDRIYQGHVTASPGLANWDRYFQDQAAAQAVRNRKEYFLRLLRQFSLLCPEPLRVLNVGSGPGRDMREFFRKHGARPAAAGRGARFDCLERDPMAIDYARGLCRGHADSVRFTQGDPLTFQPRGRYHIVWSAGLFDSFDDRSFQRALKHLLPAVAEGGQLVIGNFSPRNPSRPFMRFCDWELYHRGPDQLLGLAESCGISRDRISIGREREGVNLFLHIRCV